MWSLQTCPEVQLLASWPSAVPPLSEGTLGGDLLEGAPSAPTEAGGALRSRLGAIGGTGTQDLSFCPSWMVFLSSGAGLLLRLGRATAAAPRWEGVVLCREQWHLWCGGWSPLGRSQRTGDQETARK